MEMKKDIIIFPAAAVIILLLLLEGQGGVESADDPACGPWNITLSQRYVGLGRRRQFPKYEVQITNLCACKLKGVILYCGEDRTFAPVEVLPRGILKRVSFNTDTCRLRDPIAASGGTLKFWYEAAEVWPGLELAAFSCV